MTLELLTTVVAASLLGSTHCAGMCGPFVLLLLGKPGDSRYSSSRKLAAYHLGRLTTYLLLGVLAGLLGQGLNIVGWLPGSQRGAAYLAAATMFLCAAVLLLRQIGVPLQHLPIPQAWVKSIYAGFRWASPWPEVIRAWWMGLLTTWIPCGWLYAFVIVAAGSGSASSGMVIMLAFWAGTLPLLSLIGMTAGQVSQRWRLATPWIAIACCLVLGWMTCVHRSHFDLSQLAALAKTEPRSSDTLPALTRTQLPCCHDD
ncbi:MAG TPA: sulfite exporter TauE/SafE family protein [Gemmatales bacterium]|nr:sulfite exporter TauE/SafE family protein [Gemmatales bacterium]